jgi:hypothetical protein
MVLLNNVLNTSKIVFLLVFLILTVQLYNYYIDMVDYNPDYVMETLDDIYNDSYLQDVCNCKEKSNNEPKYDFNIIFTETHFTRKTLTNKQLCAIESAALHNPTAKINIFSIQNKDNLNLITDHYKNIFLEQMDFNVFFRDTPYDAWWKSGRLSNHSLIRMAHLSDGLRFFLLHKLGGMYLDLDVYTLTSYSDLIGHDSLCVSKGPNLNAYHSGFLVGSKGSKFYEACVEEFATTYDPDRPIYNGPGLIYRLAHRFCNLSSGDDTKIYLGSRNPNATKQYKFDYSKNKHCDLSLLPSYIAYPYQYANASMLYVEDADIPLNTFIYCRAIHAYDSKTRSKQINQKGKSVMDFFYRFHCPIMYKYITKF